MIRTWLKKASEKPKTNFDVFNISESKLVDDPIKEYLTNEVLNSYRNFDFIKRNYHSEPKEKLIQYLEDYVFAHENSQITKNVWQGDFGEILSGLIVSYFNNLEVPIKKMRWKFNKDRSVFTTDMIAHNKGKDITDIHYYEIKTNQDISSKTSVLLTEKQKLEYESKSKSLNITPSGYLRSYITVHAYYSMEKEESLSNEGLADFLSRYYYDKEDYDKSDKYANIVKNPQDYNRHFDLFFITEKKTFDDKVLVELDNFPPTIKPLNVTLILIENLKDLIESMHKLVISKTVEKVYE